MYSNKRITFFEADLFKKKKNEKCKIFKASQYYKKLVTAADTNKKKNTEDAIYIFIISVD